VIWAITKTSLRNLRRHLVLSRARKPSLNKREAKQKGWPKEIATKQKPKAKAKVSAIVFCDLIPYRLLQ